MSFQDPASRPQTHRHWLALGFSFALTAVTLFFVFRGIDRQVFTRLLATQDRGWLAIAAVFLLTQIFLGGERWRSILCALMRGPPPSVASVQAVFYASIFFNCLPLGTVGGDVARVWLARRFALSLSQIVLSILVDRVLTVAALVMLALATLRPSPVRLPSPHGLAAPLFLSPARSASCCSASSNARSGDGGSSDFIHHVLRMVEELHQVRTRSGLVALCFALASGACSAIGAYCIARSLGIGVGPIPMIAVTSIMTLVVALPISVAGWGVREISLVALLGLLGVDREAALALSVELGLITTLLSLPGGAVWLMLRDHRNAASPANGSSK